MRGARSAPDACLLLPDSDEKRRIRMKSDEQGRRATNKDEERRMRTDTHESSTAHTHTETQRRAQHVIVAGASHSSLSGMYNTTLHPCVMELRRISAHYPYSIPATTFGIMLSDAWSSCLSSMMCTPEVSGVTIPPNS